MKKFLPILLIMGIVAAIGVLAWKRPISIAQESGVISYSGLHWHPEIVIYVRGVKQEIPAEIGIGPVHQPIHTHDDTGIIHLEFPALVRKRDITLGQFFKNWNKSLNDFGIAPKMTVNGKENFELLDYQMKDGDKIEISFD